MDRTSCLSLSSDNVDSKYLVRILEISLNVELCDMRRSKYFRPPFAMPNSLIIEMISRMTNIGGSKELRLIMYQLSPKTDMPIRLPITPSQMLQPTRFLFSR